MSRVESSPDQVAEDTRIGRSFMIDCKGFLSFQLSLTDRLMLVLIIARRPSAWRS